MANYVKISCLSDIPYFIDPDLDLGKAVDQMIEHWERQLEQVLPDQPDLIVLPECCDRPNIETYPPERLIEYYHHRKDKVRDYLARVAKDHQCYIAYSAYREASDDTWRNSTELIDRNGHTAGVYNKNHLVIKERTERNALYGKDAPIIQTDFGRVACVICFDLNFDELRLKYEREKPDILIFSSAYHGGLMQNYWAYSCRSFFAGSIYPIPAGLNSIISPVGETIGNSTNYHSFVTRTVNLDSAVVHIGYNRDRYRAMKRKYGPKVKVHDPGLLGSVLISSETEEFTIQDMIEEFGMELLDDYFQRALAHRHTPGNIEDTSSLKDY